MILNIMHASLDQQQPKYSLKEVWLPLLRMSDLEKSSGETHKRLKMRNFLSKP